MEDKTKSIMLDELGKCDTLMMVRVVDHKPLKH